MNTVIELLHMGAKEHGDMPYLGCKVEENGRDRWKEWSFKDTDRLSSLFAVALLKLGFKKGDNLAILSEGRPQWVIGEYGVLKAGCTSVPLSTKLTEGEIVFRLDHSESKLLLLSENNYQKAMEALKEVKSIPAVIIISPRTPELSKLIEKHPLPGKGEILFYDDLISAAEKSFGEYEEKLADIEKRIDGEDIVTISYTSGTTGNPKGIMLSHSNYIDNTLNSLQVVRIEKGWRSLIMLPLDHAFAHTVGLYVFLHKGLTMYFVDSRGGALAILRNVRPNLAEINPDFLIIVPALASNFMKGMMQKVAEKGGLIKKLCDAGLKTGEKRSGLAWKIANALIYKKFRAVFGNKLQFAIGGGAMMEMRQQEFFAAIGAPIYAGYGLTENGPIVSSNSHEYHKLGTAGRIIKNLDVKIVDPTTGEECPVGKPGEIITRGGSVMKGYYKNPEATAETIRNGWLHTGDLGHIDSDGYLSVTGRAKALLIAPDGEKFSPEVIEEAIGSSSSMINQAMVYNDHCKFTSAIVTLNVPALKAAVQAQGLSANSDGDLNKIIAIIRDDLFAYAKNHDYASNIPSQWRPSSFAIVSGAFDESNGLLNATMKMVRHKVRDFYQARLDEIYASGIADPMLQGNRAALKEILKA